MGSIADEVYHVSKGMIERERERSMEEHEETKGSKAKRRKAIGEEEVDEAVV